MSKYKQIIKNIYPATPEGDMQAHNVAKLVHFCEISPQKILKVSKYIEKKAKKDLARSRIKFVGIALKIYQELIKGCRKNLNLFAANVLAFIKASMEGAFPELKIWATETFIRFAEVLDESSQYPGIEVLVTHFFVMCQYNQGDPAIRIRVREQGLRGIRAYMGILDMTDELDAFVTRYTDESGSTPRFLPIILENVTYMAEVAPNNPNRLSVVQNPVQILATDVLRDVFSRANISVTSLFRAIFGFLDSRNKWVPNTFAMMCFSAIYNCLKPQHEQILMTLLLQHLDQNRPANIKQQVVLIMVEFFREPTGHFMQILDALARHLVASVEIASQDQRARDYEEHIELQATIIHSVGVMCKKVVAQHQKMEGFNYLCDKLCYSKHIKSTGLVGAAMAMAQCILQISNELKVAKLDSDWIAYTSVNLFREMVVHSHYELRVIVQKICHSLLLDAKTLELQIASKSLEVNPKLLNLFGEIIRDTIIEQIKIKVNQPENFSIIFHTLNIFLHLGGRNEFFVSYPLIWAMQKSAAKWKKITKQHANSINTIIAAYLYAAAGLFYCPTLSSYVDEIIEKRKAIGHLCPHIEITKIPYVQALLNPLKDKYPEDNKRKAQVDYVLFDREHTSDLICNSTTCVLADEHKLNRLLAKKLHRSTRTLTRDPTMDFSSPPPDEAHLLLSPADDKPLSVLAETTELTPPPPASDKTDKKPDSTVIVMQPKGFMDEPHKKSSARIGVNDFRALTLGEGPTTAHSAIFDRPTYRLQNRPFATAAQACSKISPNNARTLHLVSKVINYDTIVERKLTLEHQQQLQLQQQTQQQPTDQQDQQDLQQQHTTRVADGADFLTLSSSTTLKAVYTPPSSTLTMNFNADGLFLIV